MNKLSVIVPVYNVEAYILECLQSIENQLYEDIEVIVVDDGSTDGGGRIAEQFCKNKQEFKFFRKSNGGLMSTWMFGVEKSTGDYLGFVDSDDYIAPDMYTKLMVTAESTGADIVMCNYFIVTRSQIVEGKPYPLNNFYGMEDIQQIHDNVFPSLKGGNISSARWNKVFKRELFVENMKYCACKSRYCEDRYIVPACLFSAKTFACVNEFLYYYRMRTTANSTTPSSELVTSLNGLSNIQAQMLQEKDLYDKYKGKLDLARLNYLKIAFERNLVNAKGIFPKYAFAKELLTENIRAIILSNKKQCVNKFGKCLYFAAKLNSPWVLMGGALLNKLIVKKENQNWLA